MTKERAEKTVEAKPEVQTKKEIKKQPMLEEISVSPVYAATVYTLLRMQNSDFKDFESYFEVVMGYLKEPESASLHLFRKEGLIHSCTVKTDNCDYVPAERDLNFRDYEGIERGQKALVAPQVTTIEGEDMCFIMINKNKMLIYNTKVGDYKPVEEIDLPIYTNKQMAVLPLYTKNPYAKPRKLGVWTITGKDVTLLRSTLAENDAITEIMLLLSTLSSGISRIVERFDPLTKLPTRVAMDEQLMAAISLYNEGKIEDLSLVLFDIDDFKQINDTYGHLVGDLVLKMVSQNIFYSGRKKREVREGEMESALPDFLARWGGEEFMHLLAGSIDSAVECAKRFMKSVNNIAIKLAIGATLRISCTFGVASIKTVFGSEKKQLNEEAIKELIKKADEELYRGKKSGKNCICAEGNKPIRI